MPTLAVEESVQRETGARLIAGLDEAGRGAIAGPVVAAAVILPLDEPERLAQLKPVNDSKKLSARQRESAYDLIVEHALAFGIGCASAGDIDQFGIIPANAMAMRMALAQLELPPEYLLLDGRMKLKTLSLPQQSIIRGDALSLSIAAASILAKVSRDRHMISLDGRFPDYHFSRHKGYCTTLHVAALSEHGPCAIHRYSFAPIRHGLL